MRDIIVIHVAHAVIMPPSLSSPSINVCLLRRPDTEESYNKDVNALKSSVPGNEGVVEAITVGSEALYRGDLTGPQLLTKIQQTQKIFPKVTIGTADSWNKFADGTADALITGGVKYL